MALDSQPGYNQHALNFLKYVDVSENPALSNVKASLLYLESLTILADADHPDVQDFTIRVFDVAYKLQTEYLNKGLEQKTVRLAELFDEEIETLFNSMPKEVRGYHNLNLLELTEPLTPEAKTVTAEKETNLSTALLNKLKDKVKLSPKQLTQVLAACALLSIPSDEVQFPAGPEVMARAPETLSAPDVVEAVQTQVSNIKPLEIIAPATALEAPQRDFPFQLDSSAPAPASVLDGQKEHMRLRLQAVLNDPIKAAYFNRLQNDPRLEKILPIIGIVETNLDVNAVSESNARGAFQDMTGLAGAFGDINTLSNLIDHNLVPNLVDPGYRDARAKGGYALQQFLITQKEAKTSVWQNFLTAQRNLVIDPIQGALISNFYLQSLQNQAVQNFGFEEGSSESRNIAIFAYNAGMETVKDLSLIMKHAGISDFRTYTALDFVARSDFRSLARQAGEAHRIEKIEQGQEYLARALISEEMLEA